MNFGASRKGGDCIPKVFNSDGVRGQVKGRAKVARGSGKTKTSYNWFIVM